MSETSDPGIGVQESALKIDWTDFDPANYRYRSGSFGDAALPHKHIPDGLEWDIKECVIDTGEDVPTEPTTNEMTVIGMEWEAVTLSATVTIPEWAFDIVFPEEDGSTEETTWSGRLGIIYWCRETILRDSTEVVSIDSPGSHELEVTINRDDVYQSVKFQPALVRGRAEDEAPETESVPASDYATYAGHRVAEGDVWTLKTDHPKSTTNLFTPETKRFSEDDDLPGEDHLVFLDLDYDPPRLYLNDDHERVIAALDSDSNGGWEPAVREVAYDTIEAQIWPQLIMEAASDITADEGPETEWKKGVIEKFAEHIYGDGTSYEEAVQMLHEDVTTPERLPRLMQDIDDAIQTRNDAPSHLDKLLTLIDNRNS